MDSETTKSSQNTTGSESPQQKISEPPQQIEFKSPGKGVYKVVFSGGSTEGGTKKIRRGKKKRKHTRHKKVKKL